jgi:hypothetical protein
VPIKSPQPRLGLWIGLALIAITAFVYARSANFGFVNFDDPDCVTNNAHVRDGITWGGVSLALTSTDAANWFPLTRLSHMLDCELFGLRNGMHHATNVLIHASAVVLLFAFPNRVTRALWPSAFVGFVFRSIRCMSNPPHGFQGGRMF